MSTSYEIRTRIFRFVDRLRVSLLDSVVAAGVLVVLLLAFIGPDLMREPLAFDSARWRADRSGCSFYVVSARARMAGDLTKRLLDPVSRPQKAAVEQMLGPPDVVMGPHVWSYSSGTSTMDCMTFDVAFDEHGSVTGARLVQH